MTVATLVNEGTIKGTSFDGFTNIGLITGDEYASYNYATATIGQFIKGDQNGHAQRQ